MGKSWKIHYKWPFSIAILTLTRGCQRSATWIAGRPVDSGQTPGRCYFFPLKWNQKGSWILQGFLQGWRNMRSSWPNSILHLEFTWIYTPATALRGTETFLCRLHSSDVIIDLHLRPGIPTKGKGWRTRHLQDVHNIPQLSISRPSVHCSTFYIAAS